MCAILSGGPCADFDHGLLTLGAAADSASKFAHEAEVRGSTPCRGICWACHLVGLRIENQGRIMDFRSRLLGLLADSGSSQPT